MIYRLLPVIDDQDGICSMYHWLIAASGSRWEEIPKNMVKGLEASREDLELLLKDMRMDWRVASYFPTLTSDSAKIKSNAWRLVVSWVITIESLLLYIFNLFIIVGFISLA